MSSETTETDTDSGANTVKDALTEIHKPLLELERETGHTSDKIFRDWVELCVAALRRADDDYHDILDRYSTGTARTDDPRETAANKFSEAFGTLCAETITLEQPLLGELFMRAANTTDNQQFTPWTVCTAKAKMLIDETELAEATPDDPVTAADPTCGSGRLLVAFAETASEIHTGDTPASIHVTAADIDSTCARMAAINLVLFEVPGTVVHGDSLTVEEYQAWEITPRSLGPSIIKYPGSED